MKNLYEVPELQVMLFSTDDVLTVSNVDNDAQYPWD